MPATVPLSSPVKSMTSARALAESIAAAAPGEPVGPAIDRIVFFLNGLAYEPLRDNTESVLDILHQLAARRSARMTNWLGRYAPDAESAHYWYELHELVCLAQTA